MGESADASGGSSQGSASPGPAGGLVGVGLMVAAYTQERAADVALEALSGAGSDAGLVVDDAAVVRRDAEGRVHISETGDMRTGAGAGVGALIGGVIGILGGPAGIAIGAGAGAAIGGLAAHADSGFDQQSLQRLGAALPAGTSALVVTTSQGFVEEVRARATAGENLTMASQIAAVVGEQLTARRDVLLALLITEDGVSASAVVSAPDELAAFGITATDAGVAATAGVLTPDGAAIAEGAVINDSAGAQSPSDEPGDEEPMTLPKQASRATVEANRAVRDALPFDDDSDFENAQRGLIAEATGQITDADGNVVWDIDRWAFLDGEAPDTVNPSLWRQGRLASIAGLFEVVEGVYQVRGLDLSVTSFLRTDSGWIVVDPLISVEPMQAAFALVKENVADLPVVAVIYTHSHIDHYGGVRAVVDQADVDSGKVRIIAPIDFLEESVSENVMLGNAMARRKTYMYGELVGYDERGSVGAGLGQLTSSGTVTLIPPTDIVSETGQEMTIDGLRMVFQHTPGAEAPAELCFFLPQAKALCMAEIATHTLHNVYTLRGAKIRDSLAWSQHIHDALQLFGKDAEVVFSSHHWPTWGNPELVSFLKAQRDLYRYLHDETVRLANHGYTEVEIAELIDVPDGIARHFANRGYYGSVSHNVKATYVYYLGWFDANPATLHMLPPAESAAKYVEYMGGSDAVVERAKRDYDDGQYRWVAQALNEVLFAEPDHDAARQLQADTFEQLGYQAENGTWRNFYLTGAKELRDGVKTPKVLVTASPDSVRAMSVPMFLGYLAMRLNGPAASQRSYEFNLVFPDIDERYLLEVGNGVLNYTSGEQSDGADATVSLTRATMNSVVLRETTLADAVAEGAVALDGDSSAFADFLALLDDFEFWFNIVTP